MEKVICVERKKGEYQGYNYDNYLIHVVSDPVNKDDCRGVKTRIIKLKSKDISNENPMLWLDKEIEILYDQYGKPVHIKVE